MKNLFALIILSFCISVTYAQTLETHSMLNMEPPNPIAKRFQEMVDFSPNLYTGRVDINIPLYTISIDGIKVPIALTYNSSGTRISDVSMPVGMGWNLIAGGEVSRTVVGKKDINTVASNIDEDMPTEDEALSLLENLNSGMESKINFLLQDADGNPVKNRQHDIFNYTTPTSSGKFIYLGGVDNEFITIPYDPIAINTSWPPNIKDKEGITYEFNASFFDSSISSKLAKIISSDKSEEVNFTYVPLAYGSSAVISIPMNQGSTTRSGNVSAFEGVVNFTETKNGYGGNAYAKGGDNFFVKTIEFTNGKVTFNYNSTTILLENIVVENNSKIIKKIVFDYEKTNYAGGNVNRWYLLSVKEYDGNSNYLNQHSFDYNGYLPDYLHKEKDFWGYPSVGKAAMSPLETGEPIVTGVYDSNLVGSKDRTSGYTDVGMLKRIVFPTGGDTEFIFESNRYSLGGSDVMVGGSRIKSISKHDTDGTLKSYKEFNYLESQISEDLYYFDMGNRFVNYTQTIKVEYGNACDVNMDVTVSTEPTVPGFGLQESLVVYPMVEEVSKKNALSTTTNGSVLYEFEAPDDELGSIYDLFNQGSDFYYELQKYPSLILQEYRGWETGKLKRKTIYANNGGVNNLLESHEYFYKNIKETSYRNQWVKRKSYVDISNVSDNYQDEMDFLMSTKMSLNFFSGSFWSLPQHSGRPKLAYVNDYHITTGLRVLDSTVINSVRNGSHITSTTNYLEYDEMGQPTIIETSTSESTKTIKTTSTYPYDYTVEPYLSMVANNIINPVIESKQYKKVNTTETLLSKSMTEYDEWYTDVFKPKTIETAKGSNTLETRITYNEYDAFGNPQEVSKHKGSPTVYLWAFNSSYPVAKIANTTLAKVNTAMNTVSNTFVDDLGLETDNAKVGGYLEVLRTTLLADSNTQDAMVSTYVFEPLVGMVMQTAPNGLNAYYCYDDFNRLKTVMNNDEDVVQYISYNYASTPELTLSKSSYSFSESSGSTSVSVTSNRNWTVSDNASWLSVSPSSGSNNGSFTIYATTNTGSARNGTVTVTADGLSQTVSISQAAVSATFNLSLYDTGSYYSTGYYYNSTISSSEESDVDQYYGTDTYANNMFGGYLEVHVDGGGSDPDPVTIMVEYDYNGYGWIDPYYDSSMDSIDISLYDPSNYSVNYGSVNVSSHGQTKIVSFKFDSL